MIKDFCSLIFLVSIVFIHSTFAQNKVKSPPKTVLTILGDKSVPPPAPLIYKAPEQKDLRDFVFEDKTFQATFPDIPAVRKQNVENGAITSYRTYRQGSFSIVNTIDLIVDAENNREKIYENVRNSFSKTPKTTVEAEREFSVDGRTGKEFDVLQDFLYFKVRVLIVGARVYEIRNTVTNWHIIGEATKKRFFAETERFFNSFKHLKSPEKTELPAPEGFLGEVVDQTYKNNFFKFSFDFPKSWYRLDKAEINLAKNVGLDALRTDKDKVNQAFAESSQKETVVFGISQSAFGNGRNSSFLVGVLKQPNSQITPEMIGTATKNFFLTNPKFTLIEDVKSIKLNGASFSIFTLKSDFGVGSINQKLFVTTRNGYSISFVISYNNLEEQKQLENILKSLKLDIK